MFITDNLYNYCLISIYSKHVHECRQYNTTVIHEMFLVLWIFLAHFLSSSDGNHLGGCGYFAQF